MRGVGRENAIEEERGEERREEERKTNNLYNY